MDFLNTGKISYVTWTLSIIPNIALSLNIANKGFVLTYCLPLTLNFLCQLKYWGLLYAVYIFPQRGCNMFLLLRCSCNKTDITSGSNILNSRAHVAPIKWFISKISIQNYSSFTHSKLEYASIVWHLVSGNLDCPGIHRTSSANTLFKTDLSCQDATGN